MRFEFGVVQLLQRILHVLFSGEFHNTSSIAEHISINNVASLGKLLILAVEQ
jgi:hypothetical protein